MPAADSYQRDIAQLGPASDGDVVTHSDTVDLPEVSRSLYVGVAGNVKVTMRSGRVVTWPLIAGWHPISVSRVWSTGTTATGICAAYR